MKQVFQVGFTKVNSFGDQMYCLSIDGEQRFYCNAEGEHQTPQQIENFINNIRRLLNTTADEQFDHLFSDAPKVKAPQQEYSSEAKYLIEKIEQATGAHSTTIVYTAHDLIKRAQAVNLVDALTLILTVEVA